MDKNGPDKKILSNLVAKSDQGHVTTEEYLSEILEILEANPEDEDKISFPSTPDKKKSLMLRIAVLLALRMAVVNLLVSKIQNGVDSVGLKKQKKTVEKMLAECPWLVK